MKDLNTNLFDFFLNASDGMMIFNEDEKVIIHNKAFLQYIFCDKEDLSGGSLSSCFQKEFYQIFSLELKKLLKDPSSNSRFEYNYNSSGPVRKWVKVKFSCGSEYEGKNFL